MIQFIITFAIWAAFHSLTASLGFKEIIRNLIGHRAFEGMYRLGYNLVSLATFLPVLVVGAALIPDEVLWRIDPPLMYIFFIIQLGGVIGLLWSLLQTDAARFAGLRQALGYLKGDAVINPQPELIINGSYRYVRHPLYLFSLIVLWFFPIMSSTLLAFNVLTTIYFWVGSIFEERRLQRIFGDSYVEYKQSVPRLIPIKIRR